MRDILRILLRKGFSSALPWHYFQILIKQKVKAGKWIWPISWLVEKGIGHRTLTHSWVMLLLPALLNGDKLVALAALYGLLSHLISDAVVGRIQLFWGGGIPFPRFLYGLVDQATLIGVWVYIMYSCTGARIYLSHSSILELEELFSYGGNEFYGGQHHRVKSSR